jgi:hypothetical protein
VIIAAVAGLGMLVTLLMEAHAPWPRPEGDNPMPSK